jgi:hypothetical protein
MCAPGVTDMSDVTVLQDELRASATSATELQQSCMQQLQQRYKSERHTSCGRAPHLCARCRQSATSRQVSAERSADTWRDVDTERSADALLKRGGDTCRCLRHVSAGRQQSALTPPRGVSRALCCHLALCARRSTGALCCSSVAALLQQVAQSATCPALFCGAGERQHLAWHEREMCCTTDGLPNLLHAIKY